MKVSEQVLEKALHAIQKGAEKHGDTEKSFGMIAEMWGVYLTHSNLDYADTAHVKVRPHDVAALMAILKTCRAVYAYEFDNYVDDAGYTALACMLNPETTHGGR